MKITKTNYEEYALDYIEGTLSKQDSRDFERFLDAYPEIAAQILDVREDMPVLLPDFGVRYEGKSTLKRKASIRSWAVWAGSVAAALVVAIGGVNLYETEGGNGILPAAGESLLSESLKVSVPENRPEPADENQKDNDEILDQVSLEPTLVADAQVLPTPKVVKPPVEKTVKADVEPKRSLLRENTFGEEEVRSAMLKSAAAAEKTEPKEENEPLKEQAQVALQEDDSVSRSALATAGLEKELAGLEEMPLFAENMATEQPLARNEEVVFRSEEYVVEQTNEVVLVLETRDYFQDESNKAGFLNVFSKKGMKRLAVGILSPISELSPIKVYESHEERVVEFASIPVSRKNKQLEEELIK